ncbi:MAG: hypothetical protein NWF05_08450 [Candidatus Bathyarchaeota archaeon]|nr:hypothetical protein [Candidatus Bathyarchaeota archaeon]
MDLANVSLSDVRDAINVGSADVPDVKLEKMIKRAEAIEGVDADFRVLSVEYHVDGAAQMLETTLSLGREAPLMADYVYALRAKTDSLSQIQDSEAVAVDRSRRVVVEVSVSVHRELRKHALLNDLKIYELTDALLKDALNDDAHLKATIKKLGIQQAGG